VFVISKVYFTLKQCQICGWHLFEGDDFILQEVKSMFQSSECKFCAVAPVHFMATYSGCVIRAALIISHDFIYLFFFNYAPFQLTSNKQPPVTFD
jgi:hypothetical protein